MLTPSKDIASSVKY